MSIYNVWLCDPLDETKGKRTSVAQMLDSWFNPIAKKAGFDGARCSFPQYVVHPKAHELLIYLCPDSTSVVQNMHGRGKNKPHIHGAHMGITVLGAETGSEVWMKMNSIEGIAAMIFHEAMHNKLQMDDAELHNRFSPCRLSCASMNWTPPVAPTTAESDAMAAALKNPVAQWNKGQRILRNARLARKNGDPAWNAKIV